ncbi:hypothetical protein DYB32_004085 [Aphanomyces invadans]|uniref:Uncharacterized protein n=1 Tax=Aphanomyces invadans TaxID=157072 RepID=A0A418AYL4_9STRA|nr:hypothetical protein DYB32_004085 [Aphanomyces invadans]
MSDHDARPKAKKDQRYRCSLCHKSGQTIGYNAVHCHWDRIHKDHGHPSSRTFRELHIEVAAPGVIVDGGHDDPENDTEDEDGGTERTNPAPADDATPVRTKAPVVRKKREKKRGINELLNEPSNNSSATTAAPMQQTTDTSSNSRHSAHNDQEAHHPRGTSPRQSPHPHQHQDAWAREMEHRRRFAVTQSSHHHQTFHPPLQPALSNGHSSIGTVHSLPPPYAHHPMYQHPPTRHHSDNEQYHHEDERLRGVAAAALAQASSSSAYPEPMPDPLDPRHMKRETPGMKGILNDDTHRHQHLVQHAHQHHHHPPYHSAETVHASQWEHALERLGQRLVRAEETIMLLTHRCNQLSDANQHLGQLLSGVDANLSNLNGIVNDVVMRSRPPPSAAATPDTATTPPVSPATTGAPAAAAVTLAGLNVPSSSQPPPQSQQSPAKSALDDRPHYRD